MQALAGTNGELDSNARSRIVAAATRLFGALGYHGASLRDIAREAELQPGLIHYYFGSKENLLFEILAASVDRHLWQVRALAAAHGTATDKLAELARIRVRNAVAADAWDISGWRYLDTVLTAEHSRHLRQGLRETLSIIESFVDEVVRSGQSDHAHPHAVAELVLSMGDGVRRWFRPGGALTLDEVSEIAAEITVRAVTHKVTAAPL